MRFYHRIKTQALFCILFSAMDVKCLATVRALRFLAYSSAVRLFYLER